MNTDKSASPERGPATSAVRQLLQFIRVTKASAEAIATDDHATMDEIEQALANAEAAAERLLTDLQRNAGEAPDGIVDIDDF